MKLIDMTLAGFVDTTASDAPAPGGGSVSALEGALGAALAAMVCALTLGKKKYADVQELAIATEKTAQRLKGQYLEIIDRDTEAFNAVSAVFAMPKETEADKAARKAAMQAALKLCTETPIEMMELALETLRMIEGVSGRLNASAASDLGCAILAMKSSVQGAWLNVLINIGGIDDEAFVHKTRIKGASLLAEALPLADRLYQSIEKSLE